MKLPFPQRGSCVLPNTYFLPPVLANGSASLNTPAYQMVCILWRDTILPHRAIDPTFARCNEGMLCRMNAMYA